MTVRGRDNDFVRQLATSLTDVALAGPAAVALTGGFHWALRVSGLTALAGVPVTFLLVRRGELTQAAVADVVS